VNLSLTLAPTVGTTAAVLSPNNSFYVTSFEGLYSAALDDVYWRKQTDGGAVAVYSSGTRANEFSGTIITRQADTQIPTSGTAVWSGDYLGIEVRSDLNSLTFATVGQAIIEANFETGVIGGKITDRMSARTDGPVADITFYDATIGTDGNASEGARGGLSPEGTGVYSLLITGSEAESVVGQLTMNYSSDFKEHGVFIAE